MRHGAHYVVMRLAPPIGFPDEPRRVTVAHRALTCEAALTNAQQLTRYARTAPEWRAWIRRAVYWIEHRRAPAHRRHIAHPRVPSHLFNDEACAACGRRVAVCECPAAD